jgi:hypothetical protein
VLLHVALAVQLISGIQEIARIAPGEERAQLLFGERLLSQVPFVERRPTGDEQALRLAAGSSGGLVVVVERRHQELTAFL